MKKILLLSILLLVSLQATTLQKNLRALMPSLNRQLSYSTINHPEGADDLNEFISQPTQEEKNQRQIDKTILEILMELRASPKTYAAKQALIRNVCDCATKDLTADRPAWKYTVHAAIANEINPLIELPLDFYSKQSLMNNLKTALTEAISSEPTITQADLDDLEQFMVK